MRADLFPLIIVRDHPDCAEHFCIQWVTGYDSRNFLLVVVGTGKRIYNMSGVLHCISRCGQCVVRKTEFVEGLLTIWI